MVSELEGSSKLSPSHHHHEEEEEEDDEEEDREDEEDMNVKIQKLNSRGVNVAERGFAS